jgi:hypothetical protein
MEVDRDDEFDPLVEMEASKAQLKQLLYPRINMLKVAVVSAAQKPAFEKWHSALIIDFIHGLESYCEELRETIGKDRLSAAAWSARSLLELLVWIKFCRASDENARRFHEDALRDAKGLVEAHAKTCEILGIDDKTSVLAMEQIQVMAKKDLELEGIDAKYLAVATAAKATDSVWSESFTHLNKMLSKFAHPTAALLHGILPHDDTRRDLQACVTVQGVHFASHCVAELEGILGVVEEIPMAFGYQATDGSGNDGLPQASQQMTGVETSNGGSPSNFFLAS